MASHTAVFELEGAKAQVIDLSYSFSRSTRGQSQSLPPMA